MYALTEITEEIKSSRVDSTLTDEELEDTILWRAWDRISNHTKDTKKSKLKKLVLKKRIITIKIPDTHKDLNNKQIKNLESLKRNL